MYAIEGVQAPDVCNESNIVSLYPGMLQDVYINVKILTLQ